MVTAFCDCPLTILISKSSEDRVKSAYLANECDAPHFIGAWQLDEVSVLDDLVTFFEENNGRQRAGVTVNGVNTDAKDTTNIAISPRELRQDSHVAFKNYFRLLSMCYQDYVVTWPFLRCLADDLEVGEFNVARYLPGQHFQAVHAERTSIDTLQRFLVWMTYLNDVEVGQGGRTHFTHYGIKVQPKKGLTLIWPAEWTHAHNAEVLLSGSKYIVTGWMCFGAPDPK